MNFLSLTFACLCICLGPISARAAVSRIIGGQVANAGQFPWQAAIYKHTSDGRYFCGGSLISNQWILTAAQCVDGATDFTIQLGSNRLTTVDDNRVTVATSTYFIHGNYDPATLANDVGLIKLRIPIVYNDYIQNIDYANIGYIHGGRQVIAAGWGQISDDQADLSDALNYVEVSIITNYECQGFYGNQITSGMTCIAGNYNEGTCFGDIGGPLTTKAVIGNHSMLIATASFISDNGCETIDPSGYTRTETYYSWIRNTTRDN